MNWRLVVACANVIKSGGEACCTSDSFTEISYLLTNAYNIVPKITRIARGKPEFVFFTAVTHTGSGDEV